MANLYLGIDPGIGGGLAVTTWGLLSAGVRRLTVMPETPEDIYTWLHANTVTAKANGVPVQAVIERQTPRPTTWMDKATGKFTSSILKSTCLLYGNYQLLIGLLTALAIPYEAVDPKAWQGALGIPPRVKGEAERKHKNRLKVKAQALYPRAGATLATCDALLLAHYAILKHEGKLVVKDIIDAVR